MCFFLPMSKHTNLPKQRRVSKKWKKNADAFYGWSLTECTNFLNNPLNHRFLPPIITKLEPLLFKKQKSALA